MKLTKEAQKKVEDLIKKGLNFEEVYTKGGTRWVYTVEHNDIIIYEGSQPRYSLKGRKNSPSYFPAKDFHIERFLSDYDELEKRLS